METSVESQIFSSNIQEKETKLILFRLPWQSIECQILNPTPNTDEHTLIYSRLTALFIPGEINLSMCSEAYIQNIHLNLYSISQKILTAI